MPAGGASDTNNLFSVREFGKGLLLALEASGDGRLVGSVMDLHSGHVYSECQFMFPGGFNVQRQTGNLGYRDLSDFERDRLFNGETISSTSGGTRSAWADASLVLLAFTGEGAQRMPIVIGQLLNITQGRRLAQNYRKMTVGRGTGQAGGSLLTDRDHLISLTGGTQVSVTAQGGLLVDTGFLRASDTDLKPVTGLELPFTNDEGVTVNRMQRKTPFIRFFCTETRDRVRGELSVILRRWSWKVGKEGGGSQTLARSSSQPGFVIQERDHPLLGARVNRLLYAAFKHFEQRIFQLETQMLWCWHNFVEAEAKLKSLDGALVANGTTLKATDGKMLFSGVNEVSIGDLFEHMEPSNPLTGTGGKAIPFGLPATNDHLTFLNTQATAEDEKAVIELTKKMRDPGSAAGSAVAAINAHVSERHMPPTHGSRLRGLVRWFRPGHTYQVPTGWGGVLKFQNAEPDNSFFGIPSDNKKSGREHPAARNGTKDNNVFHEESNNFKSSGPFFPGAIEFHFPCEPQLMGHFSGSLRMGHYHLNNPEKTASVYQLARYSEVAMNLFASAVHYSDISFEQDNPEAFGQEIMLDSNQNPVKQLRAMFFLQAQPTGKMPGT